MFLVHVDFSKSLNFVRPPVRSISLFTPFCADYAGFDVVVERLYGCINLCWCVQRWKVAVEFRFPLLHFRCDVIWRDVVAVNDEVGSHCLLCGVVSACVDGEVDSIVVGCRDVMTHRPATYVVGRVLRC
jgi:hypothetical protein